MVIISPQFVYLSSHSFILFVYFVCHFVRDCDRLSHFYCWHIICIVFSYAEILHFMKTELQLQNHLERVKSCGVEWHAIRQRVGANDYVIPVARKCHSRFCPDCSWRRRKQLIEKMKYFQSRHGCIKMELTFDDSAPDPYLNPRYYSETWDRFIKRLRRVYPSIKYFRVVELTKSGRPHFHILLDRFVSHEWVTENFPAVGGAKINWEKWIDKQNVFSYITKYITKATGAGEEANKFFYLTGMRQFSASRGLYFMIKKNRSFYVVCMKGDPDLEAVLSRSRRNNSERLVPLARYGPGPEDVFIVWSHVGDDLFLVPSSLCSETRTSLFQKRFDQTDPHFSSPYAIFA